MLTKTIKSPQEVYETFKIVSAIFILLAFIFNSYILLTTSGTKFYEVSIYSMYPNPFWINFILTDALTLFWLLSGKLRNNYNILVSMALFLNQLTVLTLPLFRGYFIYGKFDVLEHLGRVRDILLTAHIGYDNFYPIMHILIAEINLLAESDLGKLTVLLPAFFWIMLLPWYFIFIKYAINGKIAKLSLLGWMLFSLGYWHTSMVGNMFSYVLMFLILGVWLSKMSKTKKYLLTSILYVNLVYFHPLTSMYLLIILTSIDILNKVLNIQQANTQKFLPDMAILVFSVWITWYLSFPKIQRTFKIFWISLMNPNSNPFLSRYVSNVIRYHLSMYTLIKFAAYRYFGVGVFSFAALILIIHNMRSYNLFLTKTKNKPYKQVSLFSILFFIFSGWSFLNMFLHFVNFERSLRYVLAFSLPLGSVVLFERFPKRTTRVIFIVALIVLSYFSVFTVHKSPLSGNPNMQVSASEYYGMGWWFSSRNKSTIGYDDGQITQFRFYEAWFGRDKALKALKEKNLLPYARGRSLIPEHFGYDQYSTAGELFPKPCYFIIGSAIWKFYTATIPDRVEYWKWRPQEYKRLKIDPTVDTVYSSTDVKIYWIVPEGY